LEVKVTIEYDDAEVAESVARAVSPENSETYQDLSVKTTFNKKKVVTRIRSSEFRTFVATIDDLLFSIATAEKAVAGLTNLCV